MSLQRMGGNIDLLKEVAQENDPMQIDTCEIDKKESIKELSSNLQFKGITEGTNIDFVKLGLFINKSVRKAVEKIELKVSNERLKQLEMELISVKNELDLYKKNKKIIMIKKMSRKEAKKNIFNLYN